MTTVGFMFGFDEWSGIRRYSAWVKDREDRGFIYEQIVAEAMMSLGLL